MLVRMPVVMVHGFPATVTGTVERNFLCDLQPCLDVERPRIVLDCSGVHSMDDAAVHLLLSCLEEALKRNGDVKLAALHAEAEEVLRTLGVDCLFERYSSAAEAVQSFRHRPGGLMSAQCETGGPEGESESAA